MDKLDIVLWGRQRQTLNGYFSINNEAILKSLICDERADLREMCYEEIYGKRLSIDRENRSYHIEATFPNLRHS